MSFSKKSKEVESLLCVDCLVEDGVEKDAITVHGGFALCRDHLFVLCQRGYAQNKRSEDIIRTFLNRELGMEPDEKPVGVDEVP